MRRLLLCLLLLAPARAMAQADLRSLSPGDVAALVLLADSANDMPRMLRYMHPEAVQRARDEAVWTLKMFSSEIFDSLALAMGGDSSPGRDRAMRRHERWMLDSVYRVGSIAKLERLAPESVFARSHRMFGPRQDPLPRIVGVVLDADTLAYVVLMERAAERPTTLPEAFPESVGPPPPRGLEPSLMVLRRYRREWRAITTGVRSSSMVMFGLDDDEDPAEQDPDGQ